MTNYLITGANSDIGVACIQKIIDSGGSVIAVHRNLGSKLTSISHKHPSSVELYKLDFSDYKQVDNLLDLVEASGLLFALLSSVLSAHESFTGALGLPVLLIMPSSSSGFLSTEADWSRSSLTPFLTPFSAESI